MPDGRVAVTWASCHHSNPGGFIVPGYSAGNNPSEIEQTFANLRKSVPGINGGFIWNSGSIFGGSSTPKQYAQVIIDGLA